MHYAMSDIHGCYEKYCRMLEEIAFSDRDTLFFLGDAADRGPEGIRVIQDLMRRPNVICLLGNHEDMFRRVARFFGKKLPLQERGTFERTYVNWTERNGGLVTLLSYAELPESEQQEILAWLEGLPTYYEIALEGRAFLLAHAGVGRYEKEKDPAECELFDFIWERMDYRRVYYKNKLLVTGHTPTVMIDRSSIGRIVKQNHHIAIDCGAVYTGVLGCICLETLEEFYVS